MYGRTICVNTVIASIEEMNAAGVTLARMYVSVLKRPLGMF